MFLFNIQKMVQQRLTLRYDKICGPTKAIAKCSRIIGERQTKTYKEQKCSGYCNFYFTNFSQSNFFELMLFLNMVTLSENHVDGF